MANAQNEAGPTKITSLLAQGHDVEIIELDISGHTQRRWVQPRRGPVRPIQRNQSSTFSRSLREWRKAVMDAFLPVGFPHSVSDDYLAYQLFDSLQAFFSTISSLLANRALLQGLGVGDGSSSATFAMLLTILKDAMSRIATILFAQRFGLRIEPDAKRYRFLADLFNDSAFFLELYSPYLGSWGKVVALSTGEALRALCGVAAGASKAALSVHFAKHDNLAELNAKEASQETAVGLVGLLVGTLVVKTVEDHTSVVYLMILLVLAHLAMNYLGVSSVCMNTLNRQRATILFEEFLKNGNVLSPSQVAARESILFWSPVGRDSQARLPALIEFAESYGHATGFHRKRDDVLVFDGEMHTKFLYPPARNQPVEIQMVLWKGATAEDAIRAWFGAMEMARLMGFTGEMAEKTVEKLQSEPEGVESEANEGGKHESKEKTQTRGRRRRGRGRGRGREGRRTAKDREEFFGLRHVDKDLWEQMADKGWNVEAQSLETKAPVRIDMQRYWR